MPHRLSWKFAHFSFRCLRHRLLLAGVIALSLLTACAEPPAPSLRIGISPWPGYDVVYYAEKQGLFTQAGVDVTLVRFDNLEDSSRALLRGQLDAAFSSTWDLMQLPDEAVQPEVVLITNISAGADGLLGAPGITHVSALAGRRVGVQLGIVSHVILLEALKLHGINPAALELVDVSQKRGSDMLRQQQLDAVVLWEPTLSTTAHDTMGHVLFTTREVDSLVVDNLVQHPDLPPEKQAAMQAFVNVWFHLMQRVETNPRSVFTVVADALNQPLDTFARSYAGLRRGDAELNQRMFEGRLLQVVDDLAELMSPQVTRLNPGITLNPHYVRTYLRAHSDDDAVER